ncbi:helix-turn-helix domain-containing protein [Epibacterium sp. DP7N7-1]|nr:helix-turn-helix domain-containing protein [Epibacterium sp. DP7N7-1]
MENRRIGDAFPDELKPIMRQLGSDLTAARKARRITQADMAERLNVGRWTLGRLEKGDPRVSFGTYAMAAYVLGMEQRLLSIFAQEADPEFQKQARLNQPKRVRNLPEKGFGDMDF